MQVTYDGEHSVLIGRFVSSIDKYGRTVEVYNENAFFDTWNYYGLIPQSRPVIAPPDVQENTIEVPGSNGIVDLSEVLIGHPLYYNRSGSLDFYVDHTHETYTTWENAYDRLLNDLHGMNKKLILKDGMGFFYEGRLKVNSWKSDKLASSITLDYNFAPYKRMLFTSGEDWLWDPFDFVNGVIPNREAWYERIVNNSEVPKDVDKAILILGRREAGVMPVVPDIILAPEGHQDILSGTVKPTVLFATGDTESEVRAKLKTDYNDKCLNLEFKESERIGKQGTEYYNNLCKHDPQISIGAPIIKFWGFRLITPFEFNIKMVIDFRQGRL